MTVIDTLKFVAFNPLQNNNPIAARRRKLIAKIDEQIQLAVNKDYTPTQHKWMTDEQGKQTKVEVAKRVKRWWTASVDGKINLVVRYGSKPLEFSKQAGDIARLLTTITLNSDKIARMLVENEFSLKKLNSEYYECRVAKDEAILDLEFHHGISLSTLERVKQFYKSDVHQLKMSCKQR